MKGERKLEVRVEDGKLLHIYLIDNAFHFVKPISIQWFLIDDTGNYIVTDDWSRNIGVERRFKIARKATIRTEGVDRQYEQRLLGVPLCDLPFYEIVFPGDGTMRLTVIDEPVQATYIGMEVPAEQLQIGDKRQLNDHTVAGVGTERRMVAVTWRRKDGSVTVHLYDKGTHFVVNRPIPEDGDGNVVEADMAAPERNESNEITASSALYLLGHAIGEPHLGAAARKIVEVNPDGWRRIVRDALVVIVGRTGANSPESQ